MQPIKKLTDGLFNVQRQSVYDATNSVKDDRKNLGHNYSGDMLLRNVSQMLIKNDYLRDFLLLLQSTLAMYVDSVTYLRIYKSYTVKKNYKNVR